MLVTEPDLTSAITEHSDMPPTLGFIEPVPPQRESARRCPRCDRAMIACRLEATFEGERVVVAVELDRCAAHGMWFDANELAAALEATARVEPPRRKRPGFLRQLFHGRDPGWDEGVNIEDAIPLPRQPPAARAQTLPPAADPDAALARFAEEGQRRTQAAHDARTRRYEWVRLERLCDAMKLMPVARVAGDVAVPTTDEFPLPEELVLGQEDSTTEPSQELVASAARKAAAERAWLASLAFAVDHYFAVLALAPRAIFRLTFTIHLADSERAPSLDVLRDIVHVHDVNADVGLRDDGMIAIECDEDAVSLPGYFPYTVQNIAPYIHGLVDKVLVPLHASHPIARVAIARVDNY